MGALQMYGIGGMKFKILGRIILCLYFIIIFSNRSLLASVSQEGQLKTSFKQANELSITSAFISKGIDVSNYRISSFTVKEGEQLEIFCPMCHANLKAIEFDEHLAKISMMDESQKVYEIVFSEIVGEHCTYKLVEHSVESYGEDKNQYTNFFGPKNRM